LKKFELHRPPVAFKVNTQVREPVSCSRLVTLLFRYCAILKVLVTMTTKRYKYNCSCLLQSWLTQSWFYHPLQRYALSTWQNRIVS